MYDLTEVLAALQVVLEGRTQTPWVSRLPPSSQCTSLTAGLPAFAAFWTQSKVCMLQARAYWGSGGSPGGVGGWDADAQGVNMSDSWQVCH